MRTELNVLNLNLLVELVGWLLGVLADVPKENVAVHRPTEKQVGVVE